MFNRIRLQIRYVKGIGIIFLITIEAILLLFVLTYGISAQTVSGSDWSEPFNLSNSVTSSASPAIAADQYGDVHVFWSEALDGRPHPEGTAPTPGNAIMYRQLKDGQWSDAVDIFYAGKYGAYDQPSALVDKTGRLHLIWLGGGGISYSSVSAWDATSVKSWSTPELVVSGYVSLVKLLDLGQKLMVIYTYSDGETYGIYSKVLDDNLIHAPVPIWTNKAGIIAQEFDAAVDGNNHIHVVWAASQPGVYSPFQLVYARSENEGETWSSNRVVARQYSNDDSLQFAYPWIAVRGKEEIHIQWAQGSIPYRWHEYSTDGGKNWSQPYQIWPDLVSQTSSRAVSVDSVNNLYWIDVLRYPNGAYLIRWVDGKWQTPEMFYLNQVDWQDSIGNRINVHVIRSAISSGNELHIVFVDQSRAEIWYMHKTLPAGRTLPEEIPTQTPTPDVRTTPSKIEANTGVTPTQTPLTLSTQSESGNHPANNFTFILVLANLPVLILVSIFIFKKSMRK